MVVFLQSTFDTVRLRCKATKRRYKTSRRHLGCKPRRIIPHKNPANPTILQILMLTTFRLNQNLQNFRISKIKTTPHTKNPANPLILQILMLTTFRLNQNLQNFRISKIKTTPHTKIL